MQTRGSLLQCSGQLLAVERWVTGYTWRLAHGWRVSGQQWIEHILPGHLECPLPALPGLVGQICREVAVCPVQQNLHSI